MSVEIGGEAMAQITVGREDLASVLAERPGDAFPPVLSTARMVGLMELAASRVLHPMLREGQLSVGVAMDIVHTAATPLGARVTAEARLTAIEGKLYVFEVTAHDPGGEIGRGRHKRAIVASERLLSGAMRRGGTA